MLHLICCTRLSRENYAVPTSCVAGNIRAAPPPDHRFPRSLSCDDHNLVTYGAHDGLQLTVFPRVTEPHILALADTRPAAHAPPMMLVTVSILDPQGRSAVRLQPNNPLLGSPEIHVDDREGAPEPMTELDVEKLAWGVGQVRKIMNTPPLRELTMGEVYPGPGVSGIPGDTAGEDDCLLDWVSSHAYSNSHWCGTARMGNVSSNPEIVVDERMAVRGVKRLYIGDASVIPYIPNGNVHSTVVLVATRLAEYLQADTL